MRGFRLSAFAAHRALGRALCIFGLAAGGVCRAVRVTSNAVRSYRTISPLPRNCLRGGLFSVALSVGLLRLDVIKHRAPEIAPFDVTSRSSDFPHPSINSGCDRHFGRDKRSIFHRLHRREELARSPRIIGSCGLTSTVILANLPISIFHNSFALTAWPCRIYESQNPFLGITRIVCKSVR